MGKWKELQIEKLFKIRSGNFINRKNISDNKEFPVYGGNGITGYAEDFNLEGENIIIGRVGAKCGNVRFIKDKIWLTDNAFYISEYIEEFDKQFLKLFLEHYDLGSTANQAAQPVISFKGIKDIKIPLPPLPEQQRIVAKLDDLFAKIDQAIGLLEENIAHTQALMGSVLDAEFERLEDFEILTIDEAKDSNVIGLVRSSKTQDFGNEYEYLKMNNITKDGCLDLTNVVCVDATKDEFDKYSLKKGDFLFNTRNSIELVGKTAIYDLDKPMLFNNNIMRLRFKEGINPYFINFQFFSNKTKSDLEEMKSGTTNVAAIYYKTFKNLELKIPSINIQNYLVLKLSEFSNKLNLIAEYQTQKLNHLKALKSSLLDQAFKGEL